MKKEPPPDTLTVPLPARPHARFGLPPLLLAIALVLGFPSAALAGKGALVRVYNLTDTPLELKTDVDGFASQGEIARQLSGRIPPRSAFPAGGAVYVEENNYVSASHLDFRFSSRRGNPRIDVRYTHSYHEWIRRDDEELYVTSQLYGFNLSGTQWVINVFVSQQNFTAANWMSQIRDDVNLTDLLIPGTHDAATAASIVPYVKTQLTNIRGQLEAGVRYIDLRGGFGWVEKDTNILTYHAWAPLYGVWFTDIFDSIVAFLRKHPEETVLLQVSIDTAGEHRAVPIMKFLTERYGDFFFTENRIPDLGEARGKMVLMNRYQFPDKAKPYLGFNVRWWTGVQQPAAFCIQDNYDTDLWQKAAFTRTFFLEETRPSSAPAALDRLNINFLSYADEYHVFNPIEGALGIKSIDGMNMRTAKFLNGLASIPNFQAVVPMDAVLDERDPTDGFVGQLISYNFRRYGKEGDTPRDGRAYYLRPKSDPEDVLTVTLDDKAPPQVSVSPRLRARIAAGLQTFTLEPAGNNLHRLRTTGRANTPLYLRVADGSDKVTAAEDNPADPNQLWRLDRWRDSDTFSLISVANPGRMLTLASGNRVLAPVKQSRDARLWMFDFVE